MELMQRLLPAVEAYLASEPFEAVPALAGGRFTAAPLAQGEYNLNYLLRRGAEAFVLRVNVGSQIGRADQILYEHGALELLAGSGVTPRPFYVDDSRRRLDRGLLVMEYLPGEPLDYRRDLEAAAAVLAAVHQHPVPEERNHLIRETAPLSLILAECTGLLRVYRDSPLADPEIRLYLEELCAWAESAAASERYYAADPWPCIVNTEVNSGNFIVNRGTGTTHLVDWEMPRWGDPSQDLAHFCSPLTTLWKTDHRLDGEQRRRFLEAYLRRVRDPHLRDTLPERLRLREPFVYLRGISWSAMAWVAYQGEYAGVRNPDTWEKLTRYMEIGFIRSLFDPILKQRF